MRNHLIMVYSPQMDISLQQIERRLDDHMHQIRDLHTNFSALNTAQAVFREHQRTVENMYNNINNSIQSVFTEISDIRLQIQEVKQRQRELEHLEKARKRRWKHVWDNKSILLPAVCVIIFLAYESGQQILANNFHIRRNPATPYYYRRFDHKEGNNDRPNLRRS